MYVVKRYGKHHPVIQLIYIQYRCCGFCFHFIHLHRFSRLVRSTMHLNCLFVVGRSPHCKSSFPFFLFHHGRTKHVYRYLRYYCFLTRKGLLGEFLFFKVTCSFYWQRFLLESDIRCLDARDGTGRAIRNL